MHSSPQWEKFVMARTEYNINGAEDQKTVAEKTGLSRSLISELERDPDDPKYKAKHRKVDGRKPGYDKIVMLAKHYGVSLEYLIGDRDEPSYDDRTVMTSEELGLSQRSIDALKNSKNGPFQYLYEIINDLIENSVNNTGGAIYFHPAGFLSDLYKYLRFCRTSFDPAYSRAEEDELGFTIDVVYEEDFQKFRFASKLQKSLQSIADELKNKHGEIEYMSEREKLIDSILKDTNLSPIEKSYKLSKVQEEGFITIEEYVDSIKVLNPRIAEIMAKEIEREGRDKKNGIHTTKAD